MKRADAQAAIDEAFSEGLKRLFVIFVDNLENAAAGVGLRAFTAGIAVHDEAHTQASAAIERIFGD
jgi:hypothetical protein